jgi:hypothetical protein
MKHNAIIKHKFGQFRDQKFYRCMIRRGKEVACIFSINQFVEKLKPETQIFIDGTFKVTPIYCSQLLIVMADLDGFGSVRTLDKIH